MKIGLLVPALLLCACASPKMAPRFDRPSTTAIEQSNKRAISNISSAQKKVLVIEKAEKDPQIEAQIVAISTDLEGARNELQASEGARIQLDSQLKQQTDKANNLANAYDKSSVEITSLKLSRHRWVTYFLGASALLALSVAWIFRKPLMLLVAGFGI